MKHNVSPNYDRVTKGPSVSGPYSSHWIQFYRGRKRILSYIPHYGLAIIVVLDCHICERSWFVQMQFMRRGETECVTAISEPFMEIIIFSGDEVFVEASQVRPDFSFHEPDCYV